MSMPSGEKEIILGFIFESRTNIELALKVHDTYDEVRRTIINAFLGRLEKLVRQHLSDDWYVYNELIDNYDRIYTGFHIEKKCWNGRYGIGIESQTSKARNFIIGIYRKDEHPKSIDEEIKKSINLNHVVGSSSNYWVWYRYLDATNRSWDNSFTLLQMYDTEDTEEAIGRELIRLRYLSETLIDNATEESNS